MHGPLFKRDPQCPSSNLTELFPQPSKGILTFLFSGVCRHENLPITMESIGAATGSIGAGIATPKATAIAAAAPKNATAAQDGIAILLTAGVVG